MGYGYEKQALSHTHLGPVPRPDLERLHHISSILGAPHHNHGNLVPRGDADERQTLGPRCLHPPYERLGPGGHFCAQTPCTHVLASHRFAAVAQALARAVAGPGCLGARERRLHCARHRLGVFVVVVGRAVAQVERLLYHGAGVGFYPRPATQEYQYTALQGLAGAPGPWSSATLLLSASLHSYTCRVQGSGIRM